jgi:hypothetical protein
MEFSRGGGVLEGGSGVLRGVMNKLEVNAIDAKERKTRDLATELDRTWQHLTSLHCGSKLGHFTNLYPYYHDIYV